MNSILYILEQLEQNILKTTKTKPLADAVKNRKLITFYYTGPRIGKNKVKSGYRVKAEGVAIGLTKKGNIALRAFVQPPSASKKGFAKTGWRTFLLNRMKNVEVLDDTFDIKRPGYKEGNDGSFTVTYGTSDWTQQQPEPTKKVEPTPSAEPKPQVVKPTPEPSVEPQIEPTTQEPQVTQTNEPQPTELPQPKPKTKPSKEPQTTLQKTEPSEPQPGTPEIAPEENPEDEENTNLMESLKRIKRLMYS